MNLFFFSKVVLFFSITIVALCASHSCSHDTDKDISDFYKKFAEQFKSDNNLNKRRFLSGEEQRILSDSTLSPIRVTTDMTALDSGSINLTQKKYLISVVQTAVKFLSNFLKVVPTIGNNIFYSGDLATCLSDVNVPINDSTTGILESDLHIYIIYGNDTNSSYLANAGWCSFYETNSLLRPNFGRIKFNLGKMAATGTSQTQYQNDLMVTLHETIHILGFQGGTMQYWLNSATNKEYGDTLNLIVSNETIRGFTTTILKSTNVLNTARKYYNCPTLSGMQIENQGATGSIGSHWERTIIESEVMTASAVNEGSNLTFFTVALLKDTGFWGDVNENLADPIYWGKGKGCNFPIQACTATGSFEEFSTRGSTGCTFWNDGQGYASSDTFSDNCYYMISYGDGLCENQDNTISTNDKYTLDDYSYNSKCFLSNITNPEQTVTYPLQTRCHQYLCSTDSTVITITSSYLSDFSFICNLADAGKTKTVTYKNFPNIGSITCPSNFQRFCDNQNCKNFCSFNGICIRGMCMCNAGRTSDDCSLACPIYSENGACASHCSSTKYANMDNVCRTTCPKGYYPANGLCNLCDFSCSACSGPANSQCTACQFLTYLSGNSCVQSCPTGTYADETSKSCLSCPNGCADCTSGTVCENCNSNFTKSGNLCIQNDPCDSSCASCTSTSKHCLSCYSGNYLNQSTNTCGTTCPSGFFTNNSNWICTQCSEGCLTCSSVSLCTKCDKAAGYRPIGSSCTLCQIPCATCLTDVTMKECTSCEGGKYLLGHICYERCPDYYHESSHYLCAKCFTGCLTCQDGDTCTTCDEGSQSYPSSSSNNIKQCITSFTCFQPCATCPTPHQPDQCGSCVSPYKLQGNVCKQSCDTGYYADSSNMCSSCDSSCKECTGTSATCTACTNPMNLSKNLCISTCPSGEVAVNNVCLKPIVATKTFSGILHMILPLIFSIIFSIM